MSKLASKQAGPDAGRRQFLAAAGAAPAVALAALAATRPEAPVALSSGEDEATGKKGYHETEHIQKYYYTAAYF